MTDALLKLSHLSVGYGRKMVLGDLSLELQPGELVILIGQNGSGKSTLLKTLCGQLKPLDGEIFLSGKPLQKLSGNEMAKELSVVLTGRLHPELMTCEDVVATGRYPYTNRLGFLSKTDRKKVHEAMELTQVTELADQDFEQISDGQRQRVLLARALCQEPAVILLDEPTSFLDIRHKLEFLYMLKEQAEKKQIGILMSLHELDLARKFADRVICVKDHQVQRIGTTAEILTDSYIEQLFDMKPGTLTAPEPTESSQQTYIFKGTQKLRCGFTTGTCVTAAAGAAARMLLTGQPQASIRITVPKGSTLELPIEDISYPSETSVRCAVRKDAGDDHDVTDQLLIYATVETIPKGIEIRGGEGVGRVTRAGLDQPVGEAAINNGPRQQIAAQLARVGEELEYEDGFRVTVEVPGGEEVAQKTFNPRLGIEGGISILGTSGIVEPMSEQALIETIRTEMRMKTASGAKEILLTPGNYGRDYAHDTWGIDLDTGIKYSNFLGDTLDMAYEFQVESILLIGHIGKLVKVGSGVMNTHSRWADARMETLCACCVEAQVAPALLPKVLGSISTEEALAFLKEAGCLDAVMQRLMDRIMRHLQHRAYTGLSIDVILFSSDFGTLGISEHAKEKVERLCKS